MAVDIFLKLDGIEGESKDAKHGGEIDVLSWSWGANQTGTFAGGGGGGAGKVSMQDFSFTQYMHKGTPKLLLMCCNGKHIPKALLTVRKAGEQQQEYLKLTFTDLLVSHYSTGGSSEQPTESISLNFGKVEFQYQEQKKDGTLDGPVKAWWDLKQNIGG